MTPFRLALLNLFRRPIPTWIAIFSIALAVACSGILLKLDLLSQSRFQTLANEGQSIVGAKAGQIEILLGAMNLEADDPDFLPSHLFDSIKSQENVQFADGVNSNPSKLVKGGVPFLFFAKLGPYKVVGTSPDFIHRPIPPDSPKVAEGIWAEKLGDVVLGSRVASEMHLHIGDHIVPQVAYGAVNVPVELQVVGLLKPTDRIWDFGLFTSVEQAQLALSQINLGEKSIWGTQVLNYFLLYHDPQSLAPLQALVNKRTVAQIVPLKEALQRLQTLTGTGQTFGFMMTLLILFLASSCVSAMMITRFDAMIVQLGILRAIGYKKSELSQWLAWEGLILGSCACLIGGVLDFVLFPWFRTISGLEIPISISNPSIASLWIWIAALSATMLAVLIPLIRLYRQDVHEALKGN